MMFESENLTNSVAFPPNHQKMILHANWQNNMKY